MVVLQFFRILENFFRLGLVERVACSLLSLEIESVILVWRNDYWDASGYSYPVQLKVLDLCRIVRHEFDRLDVEGPQHVSREIIVALITLEPEHLVGSKSVIALIL